MLRDSAQRIRTDFLLWVFKFANIYAKIYLLLAVI